MSLWLVRAGSHGQQEDRCLENGFVTIGWTDLPDLSKFKSREELKSAYAKQYPAEKEGAIINRVGQIWNFSHEIKPGDLVSLPLKSAPFIAFGEVKETYKFDNRFGNDIRHVLPVKWMNKEVPRKAFDQSTLYSFGAFMTVCRIQRNNAEEKVRAILGGKPAKDESIETDEGATPNLLDLARAQISGHIASHFKGTLLKSLLRRSFRRKDTKPTEQSLARIEVRIS